VVSWAGRDHNDGGVVVVVISLFRLFMAAAAVIDVDECSFWHNAQANPS
jgi:hypothetical protein